MKDTTFQKIRPYLELHGVFLFYAIISIVAKVAASYPLFSLPFLGFYGLELALIGSYALFWQQIIKKFPLTVAFSHKAIVIFWTLLFSVLIFKESITWNNIVGAAIVIIGIMVVTKK